MKEMVYHKALGSDRHQLFWAISTQGATYSVRSGKVGNKGRTKKKTLASSQEAKAEARKLIREKISEGYRPQRKYPASTLGRAKRPAKNQSAATPRNKPLEIRAEDIRNPSVRTPYTRKPVPVAVEIDKHPALQGIASWGADLKKSIETACFASYRDKVEMIGTKSLPAIRRPNQIWKHISIRNIRIDPSSAKVLVVYVIPDWDKEEHMEWCIKNNQLVYVGQVLSYDLNAYGKRTPGNYA